MSVFAILMEASKDEESQGVGYLLIKAFLFVRQAFGFECMEPFNVQPFFHSQT